MLLPYLCLTVCGYLPHRHACCTAPPARAAVAPVRELPTGVPTLNAAGTLAQGGCTLCVTQAQLGSCLPPAPGAADVDAVAPSGAPDPASALPCPLTDHPSSRAPPSRRA